MNRKIRTLAALQEEKRRIKRKLGIIEGELSNKLESGKNSLNQVKNSLKWVTLAGGAVTALAGSKVLSSKSPERETGIHQGSARSSIWDLVGQLAPLIIPALIPVIQEQLLNKSVDEVLVPDNEIAGVEVPIRAQEVLSGKYYEKEMVDSL